MTEVSGLPQRARPPSLDEVVGNTATVVALRAWLKRSPERRNHSLLFYGLAGCGKTTLARIAAKGVGARELSTDEINASDNRKIEDARRVIQEMVMPPLDGSPRAVILDEAHELTPQAQDALLKALEDVPPHQYFMLCSTDPEKLKRTIRSRCTQFRLATLSKQEIAGLVLSVAGRFGIKVAEDAPFAIADVAQGTPRDALILLEQIAELGEDDWCTVLAAAQIKVSPKAEALCAAIWKGDWNRARRVLAILDEDPETLRRMILNWLKDRVLDSRRDISLECVMKIEAFEKPFYDAPMAQLVRASAEACSKSNLTPEGDQ